jgi:hypothetical protein
MIRNRIHPDRERLKQMVNQTRFKVAAAHALPHELVEKVQGYGGRRRRTRRKI